MFVCCYVLKKKILVVVVVVVVDAPNLVGGSNRAFAPRTCSMGWIRG